MKILSGIEWMSKDRAGGRRSGEFASVRWSSGRDWEEASLFLSESEGGYLPTAGNCEVGMSRGCDSYQPGVWEFEKVKHIFVKQDGPGSTNFWIWWPDFHSKSYQKKQTVGVLMTFLLCDPLCSLWFLLASTGAWSVRASCGCCDRIEPRQVG